MRRFMLFLLPLLAVAAIGCSGESGARDGSVIGPQDLSCEGECKVDGTTSSTAAVASLPYNGNTIGLLTVQSFLRGGTCKITILQVGLTTQAQSSFNDQLTAFTMPTEACPSPEIKVEQATSNNPCEQRETQSLDASGNTAATVVVQPDSCLPPSTATTLPGKVDPGPVRSCGADPAMCATSTTR